MYYLYNFVDIVFNVLTLAILGRVLISWFPSAQQSALGRFLYDITEPLISPIRRIIPTVGMMDFSPMVTMIVLWIVRSLVLSAMLPY